jgi:hypothetical protein
MQTRLLLTLLLSIPAAANAAENALDFAYRVTGTASTRPLLVFNDGVDTYIQPNPSNQNSLKFVGANADRQGPYYVIRGLSNDFTIVAGKASVSVSYQGQANKKIAAAVTSSPAPAKPEAVASAQVAEKRSSQSTNSCKRHQSDSAYIVSFPRDSAVMSKGVMASLKEALFVPQTIERINIVAEGSGNLPDRRSAAIKKVLLEAGISKELVNTAKRESTGIGSELQIRRVVVQCNEIKVKGIRESAKVVWNGDAGELLSAIAAATGMEFKAVGQKHHENVQINSTGAALIDVLKEIGRQIGDSGEVVLRDNEIQIQYN